jgi:transcriptional regulator with XRE-family HTH domain
MNPGQLAVAVGVTAPAGYQWVAGSCMPTLPNLERIAAVLGVSIGDLMGATEDAA